MFVSDDTPRRYWLYALKCEQSKYYVGVTSKTPEKRMQEHIDGINGAYWTEKYKPLEIVHRIDLGIISYSEAQQHENKYVRVVMQKYGVNSVRGGDLRDTKAYFDIFGTIYDREGIKDAFVALFLTVTIATLGIAFLLK